MKAEVDASVMADAVKAAASVAKGAGVTNCLRLEVVGTNMLVLGGDGDTFIELVVAARWAGFPLHPGRAAGR